VNGGRNYEDNRCSYENKSGCLLETPLDPALPRRAVTTRQVRTISRKDFGMPKNPQRLYAGLLPIWHEMRQSELHGDMQSGYPIPPFGRLIEAQHKNGPKVDRAAVEKFDYLLEYLVDPPVLSQGTADIGSHDKRQSERCSSPKR
jgi:hypothetical protein